MVFEEVFFGAFPTWFWLVFLPIMIWDLVWKGIGMWKAGRNNQLGWFVCILFFNTAGILPIIYLLAFQKKRR